jgi:hypothetical protein
MHLLKSTLDVVLPNGGPASSASMSHVADNVLFSNLNCLHCPSGRWAGGEIGSLGVAGPKLELSRPMSGGSERGGIVVDQA